MAIRRRVLTLIPLVVSSAWGQPAAAGNPNPDPRDLVIRSLRAMDSSLALRSRYTYKEREKRREFDSDGQVKKAENLLREVVYLGGKPFRLLLEKDGKPLQPEEAKAEREKLDKAAVEARGLSEEEKRRRLADVEREAAKRRERLKYLPDAYQFRLLPDTMISGRTVYAVEAIPKPGYDGKDAKLFQRIRGKIYIDKQDFGWAGMEAEALDDLTFGGFLARISKGTRIHLEQTRVNDEIWLPKIFHLRADARFLIKTYRVEQDVQYSDYRKYSAESQVTSISPGTP